MLLFQEEEGIYYSQNDEICILLLVFFVLFVNISVSSSGLIEVQFWFLVLCCVAVYLVT